MMVQWICPKCGWLGADSDEYAPLCHRPGCDYKVTKKMVHRHTRCNDDIHKTGPCPPLPKEKSVIRQIKDFVVIVDIDGTLAIRGDRRPFEYHKVEVDFPNEPVITVVKGLRRSGINPIYVTGRERQCLPQTNRWLLKYGLPQSANGHYEIYMRPDGDRRKNDVVKEEILQNDILPFYNPILALDDDERLWDVYRRYDIVMLRVMS